MFVVVAEEGPTLVELDAGRAAWCLRSLKAPRAVRAAGLLLLVFATVAALGTPSAVRAGASAAQEFEWTTYLNPNFPNDVTVSGGKVWLTSGASGVVVYDYTESTFSTIHRRPGGLSSNSLVRALTDDKGRLWFGSSTSGVDVFTVDTSRWRSFTSFEGLPSDSVMAMAQWGDSLWVGTPSGFAVFKDGVLASRCNVRLPPEVRCPLESHVIRAVAPRGGGAYLGTDAGVVWYDGGSPVRLGDPWVLGTVIDLIVHEGVPWVVTSLGVFRWDPGESRWVQSDGLPAAPGPRRLRVIDARLYAATSAGVYEWSGASWGRVGSGFNVMAVDGSETEGLWAAGVDGLYGLSEGIWRRLPAPGPSFSDDDVRSIAIGKGEVWFTGSYWTNRFDGENWEGISAEGTEYRLQGCDVYGLLVDSSNRVWFGHCCISSRPDSCLADRLSRSTGSWRWRRFGAPNIWRVAEGGGSIWLAARYTGLYRILEGSDEPENISTGAGLSSLTLSSLVYDPTWGLWIGHKQAGVDLFKGGDPDDPGNWGHVGIGQGLLSDNVRKVLVRGNRLWVGTLGGVSVVDPATMTVVRNYTVGPGGIDDRISAVSGLAVDGAGDVWVATDGNGVYVIQTDGNVLSFKTRNSPLTDNKASEVAYDAVADEVWVATFRGINRVERVPSPAEGAGAEVYVYPNPYCPDGCDETEGGPLRIGGVAGPVDGEVVDLKGQIVARFYAAEPGGAVWNGVGVSGKPVGAGLYFVVVRASSGTLRAKFTLVR